MVKCPKKIISILNTPYIHGFFYYKRNFSIAHELDKAFIIKDGISILAPEIVLFHKSTNIDNSDYQYDYK